MPFCVTSHVFTTEEEAVAAVEATGKKAYPADVEANERGMHWHDFDAVIGIVEGQLVVTDPEGLVTTCGPGSLLEVTDRPLHAEKTTAGRFVFGFDMPIEDLPRPINRDPASHPGP